MMEKETLILNYLNEELEDIPNIIYDNLSINNQEYFNSRSELAIIKEEIDNYLNGYINGRFMVLPGIRGVGKTTLLYETYNYLTRNKNISPSQVLYISYDEISHIAQTNIKEVIDIYLKNKHDTKLSLLKKKIFILVDESQYDK
ncbi:MAG: hypothetical protein BZ138_04360, partial [Methanosphaera sp. rholeuAM270]